MKRYRSILSIALVLALSLAGLAGCSPPSGTGEAPAEQPPAQTEDGGAQESPAPAGGDVTLRFSWWGGDSRHEATLEAIGLYMERNPHVKIEAEYGGFDGYQQKISTQLAGGTEPDLIQLDQPWMPTFTTQNADFFVDLRQYGDVLDLSGFSDTFLNDFCVYNGKLVGLPTGTNGLSFLANKAVLETAGVEFGSVITWDDLYEQGLKVNAADPESYMINMDSGMSYFVTTIYLYQRTGGPLVNEDYTLAFSPADLREALEYTLKLYDDKVVIPLEESMLFKGSPHDNPKWNNGQSGGWFNWASTAELQEWGEDAVALPYPRLADGKSSGVIVRPSQILSVSAKSASVEEALRFANFFFNDEDAVKILKDSRSIPANSNARQILEDNGLVYNIALETVNLAMEDPGNPETPLSTNSEVTTMLTDAMEKLVYHQYDVDAAVEEAMTLMQDVLDYLKASQS